MRTSIYLNCDRLRALGDTEFRAARINIKLNDECKNGHKDFAITADFWSNDNNRGEADMGGCCHDEILKIMPELKIFVDLHLCDEKGIPMHAVSNMTYHISQGMEANKFCDYYNIALAEYNKLVRYAEDENAFAYQLIALNILKKWENKAIKGIIKLEKLTGEEFIRAETTRYQVPFQKIDLSLERTKAGTDYFTLKEINKRKRGKIKAEKKAKIQGLKDDAQKSIDKINTELKVVLYVLSVFGNLDSFIYYNHSNEGCFNWTYSDKKVTKEEFEDFLIKVDYSKLPEGIKFTRRER